MRNLLRTFVRAAAISFSALTLAFMTLAVGPAVLGVQLGYDSTNGGAFCLYDRNVPPTCQPMGFVDAATHVYYARTGADTATQLGAIAVNASFNGFTLRRHGFSAAGDGGAADYTYSTSACSLNSGAGDGGYQIKPTGGTASGCWQAAMQLAGLSAKIWGAKCDNNTATDDATALNAAFATVTSVGAFRVTLPAGTCSFKSPLLIGTVTANPGSVITGASHGGTRLLYTGTTTTGKLVQVGSDSATPFVLMVRDLAIQSATTMMSGACLYIEHMRYGRIENVYVDAYADVSNNCWDGIVVDQPDFVTIDGYLAVAQHDAVQTTGKGIGTGYQYDLWMEHGKIGGSTNGLHITGGLDNLYFDAAMVSQNGNNVTIDNTGGYNNPSGTPSATYKNQELTFGSKFVTDQATGSNYLINDPTCDTKNYGWIHISGPITHANTYDGIAVANWPNCHIDVDSPAITANRRNGINVADTSTYMTIAPTTFITQNGNLGIDAASAWSRLLSFPAASIRGNMGNTAPFDSTNTLWPLTSTANALGANVQVTANGWAPGVPSILSGFGTGAGISQSNGTRTFVVNVGTGGTAYTGIVKLPDSSANGWTCTVLYANLTMHTIQTDNSPNTVTFTNYNSAGTATASWGSGDGFIVTCTPR